MSNVFVSEIFKISNDFLIKMEEENVLILSWNVANIACLDLNTLLYKFNIENYDKIILALQEAVNLTKKSILFEHPTKRVIYEEGYVLKKDKIDKNDEDAVYLNLFSMSFIKTIVITKKPFLHNTINVSIGPFWYINKGFLIMQINTLIIANVHLPPYLKNEKKRTNVLSNLKNILITQSKKEEKYKNFKLFLVGDFNFRNNFVESKRLLKLFEGHLKEENIEFLQTYKYIKGMNEFDNRRIPAYCARIFYGFLVKSELEENQPDFYKIKEYNSILNEIASDHKPVYLDCTIKHDTNDKEGKFEMLQFNNSNLNAFFCNFYVLCTEKSELTFFTIIFVLMCIGLVSK